MRRGAARAVPAGRPRLPALPVQPRVRAALGPLPAQGVAARGVRSDRAVRQEHGVRGGALRLQGLRLREVQPVHRRPRRL